MDDMSGSTTKRVMLWSTGRSLSTVFLKCMSYMNNVQIVSEPYMAALLVGPERDATTSGESLINDYMTGEPSVYDVNLRMAVEDEVCTYDWAKGALEASYPDKDIIFSKDIAFTIGGKYDRLPEGFRHTYLIRHPHKVFLSWKKVAADILEIPYENVVFNELPPTLFPPKGSFGELCDLMMFLKNRGDEPMPIVIDADDLQRHPDSILSQYFYKLGMSYDKSLLRWPSGVDTFKNWIGSKTDLSSGIKPGGCYHKCVTSTCFAPPSVLPTREELDEDILSQVDNVMGWYEQMYALRIRG